MSSTFESPVPSDPNSRRQVALARLADAVREQCTSTAAALDEIVAALGLVDIGGAALVARITTNVAAHRAAATAASTNLAARMMHDKVVRFVEGDDRPGFVNEREASAFQNEITTRGGTLVTLNAWQDPDGAGSVLMRRYVGHALDGDTAGTPAVATFRDGHIVSQALLRMGRCVDRPALPSRPRIDAANDNGAFFVPCVSGAPEPAPWAPGGYPR